MDAKLLALDIAEAIATTFPREGTRSHWLHLICCTKIADALAGTIKDFDRDAWMHLAGFSKDSPASSEEMYV